jgi:hypothetical protein
METVVSKLVKFSFVTYVHIAHIFAGILIFFGSTHRSEKEI